eukprot:CAMPEP_0197835570 /NCGR_PEP_ID=MMETSP1437-20131217/26231_1 /TAXON_ID=49252 ORGANISM="Eucampia antarctica, Strain CCMP1452" /NCGR_SAMPLE_ID=MMETSP1437 /ASSEMBLY_ACC=CAM_ASM_001096 /LENGTH=120 /DNA_ID=CAMNT_0043441117 /DNA_START=122 /DNA_END=487 /DNA_ORIENTATION=+
MRTPRTTKEQSSSLFFNPKRFERAVDCANEYGMCDVNELGKLADELDKFQENCFFEKDPNSCKKEAGDRIDLAELLRLQSELQLRTDYLKNANLFASDVKIEQEKQERDNLMTNLRDADW